MYTCDACTKHVCRTGDLTDAPLNCPCRELEKIEDIKKFYLEKENMMFCLLYTSPSPRD